MIKKLLLISILIFFAAGFVFAARPTEIIYPEIPGAITPVTIKTLLPKYIIYVFSFLVVFSGFICFAAFVWAGARYLTSVGDPGSQKDAQSQMLAAILGGVLVLGSYIISINLNPQIVIPHIGVEGVNGIVVYKDTGCPEQSEDQITVTRDTANFEDLLKDFGAAKSFKFLSRPGELRVALYRNQNYSGDQYWATSDVPGCRDIGERRSVKLLWQIPGVYLCDRAYDIIDGQLICKGKEKYLPADTALLEPDFNDEVKGIRFRKATTTEYLGDVGSVSPGDARGLCDMKCPAGENCFVEKEGKYYCIYPTSYYGAVLHQLADFSGVCSVIKRGDGMADLMNPPFGSWPEETTIGDQTSSVTVFVQGTPGTADTEGVWLCKDFDPKDTDLGDSSKCLGPFKNERDLGIGTRPGGWNDEVSSLVIHGTYMAVLFKDNAFTGDCEVFTRSDSNLRDNSMGRCGCIMGNWGCDDCLSSFIILPIKKQ